MLRFSVVWLLWYAIPQLFPRRGNSPGEEPGNAGGSLIAQRLLASLPGVWEGRQDRENGEMGDLRVKKLEFWVRVGLI